MREILKSTAWRTTVYRSGEWIYKRQPLTLTNNEWHALNTLRPVAFAPDAHREEPELIRMKYVERTPVHHWDGVFEQAELILDLLEEFGLRHGDLTPPHIIIRHDVIRIIDWAESRVSADPRPDKRPEGDRYWLMKSLKEMRDDASE